MYQEKLSNQKILSVQTQPDVFTPTYSSTLCIQAIDQTCKVPGSFLDLGCGCGILGLAAYTLGRATRLYASDFSKSAIELTNINAKNKNIEITTKIGSLFNPWKGVRFDYIVDSVSGIAESIAKLSPWFSDIIPCNSGEDGTHLTCEILTQSSRHLNENGVLLFPVISLSDTEKILDCAHAHFQRVEKVVGRTWMLPAEMSEHQDALAELRAKGLINYIEKFGVLICWTDIYKCYNTPAFKT